MPKTIIRDVFGELLETGKATVQGAKQVITGTDIDQLEKGAAQIQQGKKTQMSDPDAKVKQQIDRLKQQDKQQAAAAYKQIQEQIQLYRKQKASQPRKYVTAASGYDSQQHQDPETFWDKLKKQKEKLKAKLPWTSKQGMGTGEIRRGVSG